MALDLTSTRKEYSLVDPSGYRFDITLIYDPEYGWNVHLAIASHGLANEDAALDALRIPLEEALRMLRDVGR